jgi:NAD+ synthase
MGKKNLQMREDYEEMRKHIIQEAVKYLSGRGKNINTLVLGLSGGIDSALSAVLAREVAIKTEHPVVLRGYSLPIETNEEEAVRAERVAQSVCGAFTLMNLSAPWAEALSMLDPELYQKIVDMNPTLTVGEKIRAGNMKARIRMMYLYNEASKHQGMVLSTDNLTEYFLGFWTLHGDVGDFGLIQNLWKTEVYGLAKHMSKDYPILEESVIAKPTDGLGISDSDIVQILPEWRPSMGTYREAYAYIDKVLLDYVAGSKTYSPGHPVVRRHLDTLFKRRNPYNIKRIGVEA